MRFDPAEWKALLRDFPRRPGAWRVLATNLVPLAGVLLLGWVAGVATLSFFADALLTAAVLTFVLTVHAMNDTMPHVRGVSRVLGIAAIWLFLVPFVALPVFVGGMFAGGFAGVSMLEGWTLLRTDWTVQLGMAALLLGHAATGASWLGRPDYRAVRDEVREAFGLMCFKVLVLAVLGANVGVVFALLGWFGQLLLLAVIAAILTVAEVYRSEVLKAMGVDRRFHDSCEASDPGVEAGPPSRREKKRRRRAAGVPRDA